MRIFLSYARENKSLAAEYSARLEGEGHSVWWDREIPLGKKFDIAIESELRACDIVMVLWTQESVESEWVRAEAGLAERLGKLIPVLAAQCTLPPEFTYLNSLDMRDWTGSARDPEWQRLMLHCEEKTLAAFGTSAHVAPLVPAHLIRKSWIPLSVPLAMLAYIGILLSVAALMVVSLF